MLVADIDAQKRAHAREIGAVGTVDNGAADALQQVLQQSGGGVAGAIDFVGSPKTMEFGINALRKGGKLVMVGLYGGAASVSTVLFPFKMMSIEGSYVGTLQDLKELLELGTGRQDRADPDRDPERRARHRVPRRSEGRGQGPRPRGDEPLMTDEQTRIRSYLTAQATKLAPGEIVDKVRAAMDELHAAAEAIPDHRFDERPAAEEWSGNEVMAHVVTAGRHFGGAIVRLLDGVAAGGVRDQLERDVPRRSAAEWWAGLEGDRAALFARVRAVDPEGPLTGTVEHPFFGPLNWRETLLFMRLHDLDHAGQLRKIAAALAAAHPA